MTRPPFNLAKSLDPTASPKTLYRHLVRASRRHPDQHVASYFAAKWRTRAEQLLQANLDQPTLQSRLDATRKILRKLQRAANGVPEDFEWSLKYAYGLSGKSRHFLSSPFLLPSVLPVAEPIQAGNPASVPPSYSPLLQLLLGSPVVRDQVVPPQRLLVPPTLPAQAVPRHPELYIRPFMPPFLEATRRWEYFRWLLVEHSDGPWPRMRYPLVVRVINQEPGEDVAPKLRALGVNWAAYADGEREKVLDWLEVKAGKGPEARFLAPKRPPVSLESIAQLATSTPDPIPAPATPVNVAHPATRDPVDRRQVYRRILSHLPIVTIDMAKIRQPYVWFSVGLSPYSAKGPGLYLPTSPDDVGYTGDRRSFHRSKKDASKKEAKNSGAA